MNEIESIIEEFYTKKVHLNGYFGVANLWPLKSYRKILRKLSADKDISYRFHCLLLEE